MTRKPAPFQRSAHVRRCGTTTPKQQGHSAGLSGISYLPRLNFHRSADWIDFWLGWRAGKAARLARLEKRAACKLI